MKTYIQFYTMSTGYVEGTIPPKFGEQVAIEATGDRGVIQVDGRLRQTKVACIAMYECSKRGFVGYKVLKGGIAYLVQNPPPHSGPSVVESPNNGKGL